MNGNHFKLFIKPIQILYAKFQLLVSLTRSSSFEQNNFIKKLCIQFLRPLIQINFHSTEEEEDEDKNTQLNNWSLLSKRSLNSQPSGFSIYVL